MSVGSRGSPPRPHGPGPRAPRCTEPPVRAGRRVMSPHLGSCRPRWDGLVSGPPTSTSVPGCRPARTATGRNTASGSSSRRGIRAGGSSPSRLGTMPSARNTAKASTWQHGGSPGRRARPVVRAGADRHRASPVVGVLKMAHGRAGLRPTCVIHSDRGSEYTSAEFRDFVAELNVRESCGRTRSRFYDHRLRKHKIFGHRTPAGDRAAAPTHPRGVDIECPASRGNFRLPPPPAATTRPTACSRPRATTELAPPRPPASTGSRTSPGPALDHDQICALVAARRWRRHVPAGRCPGLRGHRHRSPVEGVRLPRCPSPW